MSIYDTAWLSMIRKKDKNSFSTWLFPKLHDGSWGASPEVTAYGTIAFAQCLVLPWPSSLRGKLITSLHARRNYIRASDLSRPDYLWIEKVTYGSSPLRAVYY